MEGRIIKIISNQYTVLSDNTDYLCNACGKFRNLKQTPLVGDFVVFDEVYEDLNMDKLKDMFTVKENNMPKTNSCNAKNFGELIYKKKIDSDFSKEMNRSIIENIKCFIDEK